MKAFVLIKDYGQDEGGESTRGVFLSPEAAKEGAKEHVQEFRTLKRDDFGLDWKEQFSGDAQEFYADSGDGYTLKIQKFELNDAHVLQAAAAILKARFALFTSDLQRGLERAAGQAGADDAMAQVAKVMQAEEDERREDQNARR